MLTVLRAVRREVCIPVDYARQRWRLISHIILCNSPFSNAVSAYMLTKALSLLPLFNFLSPITLSTSSFQYTSSLVLTSRRLTRLELVKIPSTDSQTALVVIHALAEALDVVCARTSLSLHLSSCVGGLVLSAELGGLGRGFSGGRGAAAEPAADCVAN
jgi:hypothetical protein